MRRKRNRKELIPESIANLPSPDIGRNFEAGTLTPVLSHITMPIQDMSSVGFLRTEFSVKNVST